MRLVVFASLLLLTSGSSVLAQPAAQPALEIRWQRLADAGRQGVLPVAASPEWPASAFLLGHQREFRAPLVLSRSRDAGATWETLPSLPIDLHHALGPVTFTIAPAAGTPRVVFALVPARQADVLLRSTDDGTSWQTVLGLDRAPVSRSVALVLSPSFATDGLAYLAQDGRLWRSVDAGNTWQQQDPAEGQLAQQVAFSPDFGRDRTLFLLATTISFPLSYVLPPESFDPHHVESLGILRSVDGGASWQQVVEGLEIDGQPYRQVQTLAISPTFAQDGTVFVYAQGPWITVDRPYMHGVHVKQAAVFRSQDRGDSWQSVFPVEMSTHVPAFALSPHFAQDGGAILTLGTYGFSPAGHTCWVYATENGGDDWSRTFGGESYQSCGRTLLYAAIGNATYPLFQVSGLPVYVSRDKGQTWDRFRPPGTPFGTEGQVLTVASDRLLAVDGNGGLWAYGPYPPCPIQPVLGFGRLLADRPDVRESLGCAVAAEHSARVHMRRVTDMDRDNVDYWPDEPNPSWWVRAWGDPSHSASWGREPRPAFDQPEATLEGSLQEFWGGEMLFVRQPDGRGTIITSGYIAGWFDD